jgi:transposase
MAVSTIAQEVEVRVSVGVDTHLDTHVAVAKDGLGRTIDRLDIPTTPAGYRRLLTWAKAKGEIDGWAIEGTGCYGAGLSRYLRNEGQRVVEVIRPDRSARRHKGKSDPVDAEAAARALQAEEALGLPKAGDDLVEAIRCLRVTRNSAMRARTKAINTAKALVVTAPAELREQLRHLGLAKLVAVCARMRPATVDNPLGGTRFSLRILARRIQNLADEIAQLDAQLDPLTAAAAPRLRAVFGAGPDVVGQILVTAGDNPERLVSEAAFANLCGVAPLEASSGKTKRHRLNPGGDRKANCALYTIVISRLRHDERTQAYMAKRTAEGKSKKEIIRCLKRYVAREIYGILMAMNAKNTAAPAVG